MPKMQAWSLVLIIAVAVFLWMSWILIAKFNEARRGQADWGEVGVVAVVGVGGDDFHQLYPH